MRWMWLAVGLAFAAAEVGGAWAEEAATPAAQAKAPSPEQIRQWIQDLDSDRYQAREDATAALRKAGYDAVQPVAEAAADAGLEAAIRAVFVLREAALSPDDRTAQAAQRALENLATTQGAAAPRAAKTLAALSDMRRRRIRSHFAKLGAKFQATQRFFGVDPFPDYSGLWLDKDWKGTEEDLAKLKFLTDVTTITVEGPKVNDRWLKHIAEMPKIASVHIKRAKISDEGLAELKAVPDLQELSIMYAPLGDAAVETLTDLRGLTVLKLYGGNLTEQGHATLKNAFAGTATVLDVRRGAFLGVSCNVHPTGCLISYVREGSAAANAQLYPGDVIVSYNGKKVEDFEGLTALIAENAPGDTAEMEILRGATVIKKKVKLGEWE